MGMPEFVIQMGVQKAWDFFRENAHVVAYMLKELPAERKEAYRRMIEDEEVSILFAYPIVQPTIPSFSIILQSETEEHAFLDDGGDDDMALPYPPPGMDDWTEHDDYGGVVYNGDTAPQYSPVDGADPKESVRSVVRTQWPRKNLDMQRTDLGQESPEHFERMGEAPHLFNRQYQRVSSRSWVDRVSVGIIVTADNQEKTFVYYRLLRWALRQLTMWFHVNGVLNMSISGSDVAPAAPLTPAPSPAIFQRQMNLSFQYQDQAHEVEAILRGWVLDIKLATKNADGSVDYVPIYSVSGSAKER